MHRHLFIVAYDIASAKRRRRALKAVKGHAIGGQKSLYECWLSAAELQLAMAALRELIDAEDDRVIFVRLDPRAAIHTLGVAVKPQDGEFFYQA
jgi:CRISPR-associated protein Cas2